MFLLRNRVIRSSNARFGAIFACQIRQISKNVTVSFDKGSSWKVPSTYGNIIGGNSLIVRSNKKETIDLSQRMWYELQKHGKQASFLTYDGKYTSDKDLLDGIALYRRTGAVSLIAIGDNAIQDYSKGLRQCLETGYSSIDKLSSMISSSSSSKMEVPLISIPLIPSSKPMLASWSAFSKHHHCLIQIPCKPPEVIILDEEITLSHPMLSSYPTSTKMMLLCQFFDVAFNSYIHDVHQRINMNDHFFPSIALLDPHLSSFVSASYDGISYDGISYDNDPKHRQSMYSSKVDSFNRFAATLATITDAVKAHHHIKDDDWISITDMLHAVLSMQYDISSDGISSSTRFYGMIMGALVAHHHQQGGEISQGGEDGWLMKTSFGKAMMSCYDALALMRKQDYDYLINAATHEHDASHPMIRSQVSEAQLLGYLEDYITMEESKLVITSLSSSSSTASYDESKKKMKSLKLRVLESDMLQNLLQLIIKPS